jgi:hypothetical protein
MTRSDARPTPALDWLEASARRVLTEDQLAADPALLAEGWERRFVADARRAKEASELYQQLGFEVRAEPLRPTDLGDDCEDCKLVVVFQFQTIYTRRKREP